MKKIFVYSLILVLILSFVSALSVESADLNSDYKIDLNDLFLITNNFGSTNSNYDINGNGKVDFLDLVSIAINYGKSYESSYLECYDRVCFTEILDIDYVWAGADLDFEFITYQDKQFVAYYDEDSYMTVASRNINSDEWTIQRLPGQDSELVWDSHNYITMDIDNEKNIHVSGNMHSSPLIYYRTTNALDVTSFQKINGMIGTEEDMTTYPEFLKGKNNELIFSYRYGQSGAGDHYYNIYNPTTKSWSRLLDEPIFGFSEADLIFGFGDDTKNWIPIAGDWNGNGEDTIGIYNQETGYFYLKNENSGGTADYTFKFGPGGEQWLPIAGDWDNDGRDTIGLFKPPTNKFYLKNDNSAGVADITFNFKEGTSGKPITGDWNNNGQDTIGLYAPSTSCFYLRNLNSEGNPDYIFNFGPGDNQRLAVTGDWDKDGRDTIGIYNPDTGRMFLKNSNSGGTEDIVFYYGGDITGLRFSGDWNDDNTDTIGIYDNTESKFYLTNANKNKHMSAYPKGPVKGPDGFFHYAFVWRDEGGAETNHDLSYARTPDFQQWKKSTGQNYNLPITIENGEIIDPIPINGGIINGNLAIGFDSQDRIIVSYHKYDQYGNTQIYNARLENGNWIIYKTSDWNYRWDFSGVSPGEYEVDVFPVNVEDNVYLSQRYERVDIGGGIWKLDENTLQIIGEYLKPPKVFPPELNEIEMNCPECDYLNIEVLRQWEHNPIDDSTGYFIRWEALGHSDEDPFGPKPFIPDPSMMRLYKYELR